VSLHDSCSRLARRNHGWVSNSSANPLPPRINWAMAVTSRKVWDPNSFAGSAGLATSRPSEWAQTAECVDTGPHPGRIGWTTGQVGLDQGVSLNRLSTGPSAPQDTRVIDAVAK